MNINAKIEVPDSLDNAAKNLTDKPTFQIGQYFSDCLYLRFGDKRMAAEKRRILEKHGLNAFEEKVKQITATIPEQCLIEPDFQMINRALEDAEYCMESDDLRTAFAKLIARACHSDYKDSIHTSFSNILKQMSPYDAQILNLYMKSKTQYLYSYRWVNGPEDPYAEVIPFLFTEFEDYKVCKKISLTFESLKRLGIFEFSGAGIVTEKNHTFFKSELYATLEKQRINTTNYASSEILTISCMPTFFGESFINACCL